LTRSPQTPRRSIRLDDETWAALERIAERRGLLYGGVPSRSEAVRFFVERESEIPLTRKDGER
jgi:predicted transcriptional regulator